MALILIVDDDRINLKVAAVALVAGCHEVIEAGDGAAAVELALSRSPALVLVDVRISGMDGVEVLRQLRADPRAEGLPVVALTAQAMKGDAERLLALGFDGHIPKPIRYREFLVEVSALLERGGAPRER
jgi:two-component system, cell cycle response regulator DivK